jgi:hypothetical protein
VTAAETLTEPLEVADAECAERAESLFEQYR